MVLTPFSPGEIQLASTKNMADELPPNPSESSDDPTKTETIRITLPPKTDQPVNKRETVRINVPGQAVPPIGVTPKKETTKLPVGGSASDIAAPPASKAFTAPPPAPKSAPGVPPAGPPARSLSGINPPPKPPALGARPTVPLKPAPPAPGGPAGPTPAPEPVTQKAAIPKKETARITLPPENAPGKPALPKATVKLQQTQPLPSKPQSTIQAVPQFQGGSARNVDSDAEADSLLNPLSIGAAVLSVIALITVYMAYAAASAGL